MVIATERSPKFVVDVPLSCDEAVGDAHRGRLSLRAIDPSGIGDGERVEVLRLRKEEITDQEAEDAKDTRCRRGTRMWPSVKTRG